MPENLRIRRSRIFRAPAGVLALHIQDVVLDLERKLVGVAIGTPASVSEPLHATFLIAIEDLVAGLAGDTELPAKFRRRLAGEPQTAFVRPSPNTPSKASFPPLNREEMLPMCPVRCVTYVSGRSHTADSDTDGIFAYHSSGGSKELDGCHMARTRSESSIPCN
jgi:hypothetical protein